MEGDPVLARGLGLRVRRGAAVILGALAEGLQAGAWVPVCCASHPLGAKFVRGRSSDFEVWGSDEPGTVERPSCENQIPEPRGRDVSEINPSWVIAWITLRPGSVPPGARKPRRGSMRSHLGERGRFGGGSFDLSLRGPDVGHRAGDAQAWCQGWFARSRGCCVPPPGAARSGGATLPSCSGCPVATMQPGDAQTRLQRGFLHCRGAGKAHSRSGSGQAGMQSTSWLQEQDVAWVWATSCSHPLPHSVRVVEESGSAGAETPSCSGKGMGTPGHGHGCWSRSLPTDSCPLNHPHLSSGAKGWLVTALRTRPRGCRAGELLLVRRSPSSSASPLLKAGPAGLGG